MGNQWGTGVNEGEQRPNWFKDTTTIVLDADDNPTATTANTVVYGRPNHPAEAENLEATERGWERVVRYGTREKREVVVANGKLGTTLAAPKVVDVRWGTAHDTAWTTASDAVVLVTFSHPVIVGSTPTNIDVEVTSTGTNFDCAYTGGDKTNQLTFTSAAAIGAAGAGILSLAANFITLNGGTIEAYNPDTEATTTVNAATATIAPAIGTDAGVRVVA